MTDFHSHILPNVDDGSKSIEESVKLLEECKKQQLENIILTPHFYPSDEDLKSFKTRTSLAFKNFLKEIENKDLPNIILGTEVLYFTGLGHSSRVNKLCIGSSRFILLELYGALFDKRFFEDIIYMINKRKVIPIIAHIERYSNFRNFKGFLSFCSLHNIPVQINAESFLGWSSRRVVSKLLKADVFCVLSTDTHSLEHRPPRHEEALCMIERKFGTEIKERFLSNADSLFQSIIGDTDD